MNLFQKHFTPGEPDPRVNVSIITPKAAIISSIVLIIYSGFLLKIHDSFGSSSEHGAELAAAILALMVVACISIAAISNYVHFITYTRPLLLIAKGAKEVSEGNYSIHLPLHRKDGKTDEIDALIQDFNTMVDDLNSTEILKSSFISNISHELKTPIAVISNYATLLSEDGLSDSERKEYSEKIRSASKDLSELIANILQITKLDNDQIKANYSSFDLSEELIQCILGFELILDE
ncbi:MAG: HAMP domain-containing histidine kinase, partial [Lachnospiraceae bacterium]|nr:HAMP domain-containing histidine kinase [Lachnospiraceae bacterium]